MTISIAPSLGATRPKVPTAAIEGAIPVAATSARPRLQSIDAVRGLIMVVMALDHVRDFTSRDALQFNPTDLTQTTAALFFTRWITHFCAPVFFFLAGTGAFLGASRGKSKGELARFLVSRGLWLVLLELTVVRCLGWSFNFDYHQIGFLVIWALGWSMVCLAALLYLPLRWIAGAGLVMIGAHNLLDRVPAESFGAFAWLWHVLHQPGPINAFGNVHIGVPYTLIPWVGVMATGYAFGALYRLEQRQRRRVLFWLGGGVTAAFVLLRLANVYGDPSKWSFQNTASLTVLSFLNCSKYPPSLLYLLMTLGPAILLLAGMDRNLPEYFQPLVVIGRVPLFYYLLHLPLIHAIAVGLAYLRYGFLPAGLFQGPAGISIFAKGYPPDYGYNLLTVYLIWVGVVLMLYPICRWFAGVKQRKRSVWFSYL